MHDILLGIAGVLGSVAALLRVIAELRSSKTERAAPQEPPSSPESTVS